MEERSMGKWSRAMNHPLIAFQKGDKEIAWSLVGLTILVDSLVVMLFDYFLGNGQKTLDLLKGMELIIFGIVTYLVICTILWAVGKLFASSLSWRDHVKAWGITYMPTLFCAICVVITENYFYLFVGNILLGAVVNIVFIGILLWKTLLFIIYLREFVGLKGYKFWGAGLILGVCILLLAWGNAWVGLRTPVL